MKKIFSWFKKPSFDIFLFAILIVLINLVSNNSFFRIDVTSPKTYTLTNISRELVKTVEQPLSIKVFFSNKLGETESVKQDLKDILIEYSNAANENFSYEFFDMDKEENQKLARDYMVDMVQIREIKNNEVGFKNVYLGLVVTYADQIEVINGLDSSDGLEYKLTGAISKVISNTNVLTGLGENAVLTFYKSDSLSAFNIQGLKDSESVIEKAFDSAKEKLQGKLEYRKVNPSSQESVELQKTKGIQSFSFKSKNGTEENGAFGAVLELGEKSVKLPLEIQNVIFSYAVMGLDTFEENLENAVFTLASKSTSVAYITGHGEHDINDGQSYEGAAIYAESLRDTYNLVEVNLSEEDIPVNVQSIIINGPKTEFTEAELYKIDQYLMKGGNIVLNLDPFEQIASQNPYQYQMPEYRAIETGLEKLLSKYGVEMGKEYVFDKKSPTTYLDNFGEKNIYYIPQVEKKNLDQKNPVSKNMNLVMFFNAGFVDVKDLPEDVSASVIAKSSPESWLSGNNFVLSPFSISEPADENAYGEKNLCVLLEGKFPSAFDGAPLTDESESSAKSELEVNSHIGKGISNGKIIVTATSANSSQIPFQFYNGNLNYSMQPFGVFARNTVDYANGNGDYCLMRTKSSNLNLLELSEENSKMQFIVSWFNKVGLAVLVVSGGLIVFLNRKKYREQIRKIYSQHLSEDKNEKVSK